MNMKTQGLGSVHVREFVNKTGYTTASLRRFFENGARALGVKGLRITCVSGPGRTRGCADINGKRLIMQLAPPSKMFVGKTARIFEHEVLHVKGQEHEQMSEAEYWSYGVEPVWSRGLKFVWTKRGRSA